MSRNNASRCTQSGGQLAFEVVLTGIGPVLLFELTGDR
jgi:hypothetical protein